MKLNKQQVLEYYEVYIARSSKGNSMIEVAKELEVPLSTLKYYFSKYNLKWYKYYKDCWNNGLRKSKSKYSEELVLELYNKYITGSTIKSISKEYNIPSSTISDLFKRDKLSK